MARKYAIIFLLALLSGCAQVGSISGGERDTAAPKPLTDQMVPQNATTNYTGGTFVIPFDEYFQLNNPAQTIRMVPPHATISAEMKKKTLYLSWEDTLEANTTYAIYLNGTIKDLNEGNDTTLQLVFATGNVLDTASYTVAVVDAYTGDPLSDITVALFDPTTDRLKSLAKSDNGVANLNFLSPGEYKMIAFEDENLDLEVQPEERVGFPEGGMITVDTAIFDSIPIRTYEPRKQPRIEEVKQIAPCTYQVTLNEIVHPFPSLYVNKNEVDFLDVVRLDEKTMLFPYDIQNEKTFELVVHIDSVGLTNPDGAILINDTTTYRARPLKDSTLKVTIDGAVSFVDEGIPSTFFYFKTNNLLDKSTDLDTSKISLLNLEDSVMYYPVDYSSESNSGAIEFRYKGSGAHEIQILKGAVLSKCGIPSEELKTKYTIKTAEDYGVLHVDISAYAGKRIVVEVLKSGKVEERYESHTPPVDGEIIDFKLDPGEYTFRVINDENRNGLWDPGKLESMKQPERIDTYSKVTKVRANWDIEVTLNPKENE